MTGLNSKFVKELARAAGFELCGICSPQLPDDALEAYDRWLAEGHHGEMTWLMDSRDRRADPRQLLPNVKSVIMLGVNYYHPNSDDAPRRCDGIVDRRKPPQQRTAPPGMGRISRYARGRDYHKVIGKMLKHLAHRLQQEARTKSQARFFWWVDYGAFFERAFARKAGLGFLGRNSMLINRDYGSWLFLAELLTTIELEPDDPTRIDHGRCGHCRRCIDACPTGAIVRDGVVDSRRCISYLTIERPSEIPAGLRPDMSDLLFGCDICQQVCPYNADPPQTGHCELLPCAGVGEYLDCKSVIDLPDRDAFLRLTAGTPLTRPKLDGLKRNATIVLENQRRSRKLD